MRPLLLVIVTLAFLGAAMYSNAQQDATCPALVDQALVSIGTTCSSLERNSACYGYHDVTASFSEAIPVGYFTQPSDRARLTTLKNVNTLPMDAALQKWGIALLSLQANLPDALPGQNTIFMLLGDTQVENGVPPQEAFSGNALVDVTTRAPASLFYLPDTAEEALTAIPENTTLPADAISAAGDWVRVVYNDVPGWVQRDALVPLDAIDTLPVITAETRTPMQAFYLRTSITGTACTEAPDSLIVQGPQNLTVDINVNGADVRLGSTIALRIVPVTPELAALFAPIYANIDQVTVLLEVFVIDGKAILDAGTPQEVVVNTGYRSLRCLTDMDNLGVDGVDNDREVFPACPWLQPILWDGIYDSLEGFDLNYPIHIPGLETPTPTATRTNTPAFVVYPTNTPTYTPTSAPRGTDTPTATVIPFDILTDTPLKTSTATHTATEAKTSTPTSTPTLTGALG